jgi:hypothetical protein
MITYMIFDINILHHTSYHASFTTRHVRYCRHRRRFDE